MNFTIDDEIVILTKDLAFSCEEVEATDYDVYRKWYLISRGLQYPTSSCAYSIVKDGL